MIQLQEIEMLSGLDGFFSFPSGICREPGGEKLYISDMKNGRVCLIDRTGNEKSVLSAEIIQNGVIGELKKPLALTLSKQGSLYVADALLNDVFIYRPDGVFESVLSRYHESPELWTAAEPPFNLPGGVAVDDDEQLYVNDFLNNRIRRIDRQGRVTTIAGPGESGGRGFSIDKPYGLCFSGGRLYFTDTGNHRILCVDVRSNQISEIVVKNNGLKEFLPIAIAACSGRLYICEQRKMWVIDIQNHEIHALIDRESWKALSEQFSLGQRICHMGALCVPESGQIYWVDTIKGYVCRVAVSF